jgi:hypothetical protein
MITHENIPVTQGNPESLSVPANVNWALVSVVSGSIRYAFDASTSLTSEGHSLTPDNSPLILDDADMINTFICDSTVASSVVYVTYRQAASPIQAEN